MADFVYVAMRSGFAMPHSL